ATLNAATGVVIYRLLKKYFLFGTAALISMVWILLPAIHQVTAEDGLEAGLNAFGLSVLLLGGSWFMDKTLGGKVRKWDLVIIGFLGALALFSRLDNMFTYLAVGIWLVLRAFPFPRYLFWDELFVIASVFAAAILRFGFSDLYEVALLSVYIMLALAMLIKPACYLAFGLYKNLPGKSRIRDAFRILLAVTAASLVLGGLMLVLNSLGIFRAFPRMIIFYDWVFTLILILASRGLFPRVFKEHNTQFPRKWLEWLRDRWKTIVADGFKFFLPGASLMVFYLGWNKLYFGTFSPISGQVKHWWSTLPNTVYGHDFNLSIFLSLSPGNNAGPWSLLTSRLNAIVTFMLGSFKLASGQNYWIVLTLLIGLIILGLALLFKGAGLDWRERSRRIGLHALLAGCLLQISYYLATTYPNPRSWYWVGEILCIVLFGAVVLEGISQLLVKWKIPMAAILTAEFIIIAWLVISNVRYITSLTPWQVAKGNEERYLADARGLEELTPPGAIIGMPGGGTVAYFLHDRTIVNLDGLMNSAEYLQALKTDQGTDFLDRMGLTYINASEVMVTGSDPYMRLLNNRLRKIGLIPGLESFTLFEYLNPTLENK
ncbi:MAG: hypothetical protein HGA28_01820, partial [Anaerolineaceae bacterium]|nr:hypothetical protein [Anaerolineaceae bacterium]